MIPNLNKHIKPILLGILGLSVIALIVYYNGLEKIPDVIYVNKFWTLCAFFLMTIVYICGGTRWGMIVNSISKRKITSYFKYVYYHIYAMLSGFFLSNTGANFITKPFLLKAKEDVPIKKGLAIALIEGTIDFLILIPAFLTGIYLFNKDITAFWWLTICYILLFFVVVFYYNVIFNSIRKIYNKLIRLMKKNDHETLIIESGFMASDNESDRIRLPIWGILFVSIARYLLLLLLLYSISKMCHLHISFLSFVIGVPIMQLSTLIAVIPWSLGVLEGGWFVVLKSLGVDGPDISVFLIAIRLWMTVFLVVIGLANFWISHYWSKYRHKIHKDITE